MSLLSVSNLAIAFGNTTVVHDTSFTLDKGQTLAIVGESGSGKSVTALSIMGLLPGNARCTGSVMFNGTEMLNAPETALQKFRGHSVAMIFQEPMTALNPLHTVEKQIAEMLWLHKGLEAKAARPEVLRLLQRVGIPNAEQRLKAYPHELSGGQRQRVMIAIALAADPDILIADEPTTALDVTIQAQILDLLKELQRERNMALLLITHDLHIVRKMAAKKDDRVAVMRDGAVVENGSCAQIFVAPRHEYTKMLLAAEPDGAPAPVAPAAPVVVQARNVRVHYPIKAGLLRRTVDVVKAVEDISFTLHSGETLGIVGESGSGKSSLVQALLRLNAFTGEVSINNERFDMLQGRKLRAARRNVQMVFQDPFASLSPRMSVGDIILEGPRWHEPHATRTELEARLLEAMDTVGLTPDMAHRYPHEFSGGQRQRIAIARALILRPKLLVLDEPTSALDRSVQKQVLDLLRDVQAKTGTAYLFISHDLAVIRAVSHRVIVMKNGEVVEAGATADVLQNPKTDYTKALLEAAFD
ncbi:MAG: ABC transporter ATP-binding protein [Bdellovibrionales bacterium]